MQEATVVNQVEEVNLNRTTIARIVQWTSSRWNEYKKSYVVDRFFNALKDGGLWEWSTMEQEKLIEEGRFNGQFKPHYVTKGPKTGEQRGFDVFTCEPFSFECGTFTEATNARFGSEYRCNPKERTIEVLNALGEVVKTYHFKEGRK